MASEYSAKFGTGRFGQSWFNRMFGTYSTDTILGKFNEEISYCQDTLIEKKDLVEDYVIDTIISKLYNYPLV